MMDHIYIKKREPENDLYPKLLRQSIERLQQMSGELWTDYNTHDPGITMTDLLNYALTELDYRLRFDMPDYLSADPAGFQPGRYGLFSPVEVFPTVPVTPEDYRKLMIDAVDEIENLWIYPSGETGGGWYDILVELAPGVAFTDREKVRRQVETLFHCNRNLCEGLSRVLFVERKPLILQGDIGIEPDVDTAQLLADIYWEALQFFVAGVKYKRVDELLAEGKTLDELLDGPEQKHWVMDECSLKPLPETYAVPHLYHRLKNLKGVKYIHSLGFREEEQVYNNMIATPHADRSYTVLIPGKAEDTGLRLLVGNAPAVLDFSHLTEQLYARHARCFGNQNRTNDLSPFMKVPEGKLRKIYKHYSVQNDFPDCYAINEFGVAAGESAQRKAQAHQLKAYLLLFDEVFGRGLKELENAPDLLDINGGLLAETTVPLEEPVSEWQNLVKNEDIPIPDKQRFLRERRRWADMLERIYGEDSNPAWLNAYNFYEDSEAEQLERRLRFLSRIPAWGRDRFKGIDLTRNSPGNVPGIKAYISTLLGFYIYEERPVINVFPFYNLKLVEDERFYNFQGHVLSHNLVPEELLKEEYMERIPLMDVEFTDRDYHVLRDRLPLLHYNLLFEGLFRGGIRQENYRILNLPMHPDRLLVFFHVQRKEWINLGRFVSRRDAVETANCLRRFLVMLNRKSETLYVLEHLYLGTGENFTVTVVFPGWSARMADARFREVCEELVCSRLPAHLQVRFRWFSPRKMWGFEQAYYHWRKKVAAGESGKEEAEQLKNIIL